MLNRQRILLYLILALKNQNKHITKTFLDKLLFLLKKEYAIGELIKFYNFYPYRYGPFSSQFYLDLNDAKSRGFLDDEFNLSENGIQVAKTVSDSEQEMIEDLIKRFNSNNIRNYVYQKYPEYAIKSLLKSEEMETKAPGIFSIGYEQKDIDAFLDILIQNKIEVLVDVRANPFSMNFSFTKFKLAHSLKKVQIEYLHIPELGIKKEYRKRLRTVSDYTRLFEFYKEDLLPKQMDKVRMLGKLGKEKRITLMCFESDKDHCHRGVLSEKLEELYNLQVTHL